MQGVRNPAPAAASSVAYKGTFAPPTRMGFRYDDEETEAHAPKDVRVIPIERIAHFTHLTGLLGMLNAERGITTKEDHRILRIPVIWFGLVLQGDICDGIRNSANLNGDTLTSPFDLSKSRYGNFGFVFDFEAALATYQLLWEEKSDLHFACLGTRYHTKEHAHAYLVFPDEKQIDSAHREIISMYPECAKPATWTCAVWQKDQADEHYEHLEFAFYMPPTKGFPVFPHEELRYVDHNEDFQYRNSSGAVKTTNYCIGKGGINFECCEKWDAAEAQSEFSTNLTGIVGDTMYYFYGSRYASQYPELKWSVWEKQEPIPERIRKWLAPNVLDVIVLFMKKEIGYSYANANLAWKYAKEKLIKTEVPTNVSGTNSEDVRRIADYIFFGRGFEIAGQAYDDILASEAPPAAD